MPTYDYVCVYCRRVTTRRNCSTALRSILCVCGSQADRVPFYLDTAVTRLPTRGPIIPARPAPKSTAGENTDTWLEMTHEEAYRQHKWASKYSRGGELADRYDERPSGTREA